MVSFLDIVLINAELVYPKPGFPSVESRLAFGNPEEVEEILPNLHFMSASHDGMKWSKWAP